MLIKELDNRLDMRCKITFNKEDRVFNLSKALGTTFQAFLEVRGEEKFCTVYIPKEKLTMASSSVKFLTPTVENERFVIATVPIEESLYQLFSRLEGVKSTSSFDISIEKGYLTVLFRFYHDALPEITDRLAKTDFLEHLVKEIDIQPATGLIKNCEEKSKEFPISVLVYEIPFAEVKGKQAKSLFQKGAIAESAAVFTNLVEQKLIFYGNKGMKTDMKQIYENSYLYEMTFKSVGIETFNVLNGMFNSLGLKRFHVFFKKEADKMKVTVFVNKYDAMKHITTSFAYYSKAGIPVSLSLSRDYSLEAWDQI